VKQLRGRKCKLKNRMISEVEQLRKGRYSQKNHRTLEEGVGKKKNDIELRNMKRWKLFQQQKK
jgi:hypothetical protein